LSSVRDDSGARALACHVARKECGYGGREIARAYGYSTGSGMGQAVRKIASDKRLLNQISRVTRKLRNEKR